MKTFKEFLLETYFTTMKDPYSASRPPIVIHKNPSRNEIHKLIHASQFKELRGILSNHADGNHLYVWDAAQTAHGTVKDHFGLEDTIDTGFRKSKHNPAELEINNDYNKEETIKSHPWVKKTLPNSTFYRNNT